jgi:Uma2 family endonuclease
VHKHKLGKVLGAEGGFIITTPGEPETVLAPDAAFVRTDRAPDPASPEYDEFWRLAPDLVVEVASPSQYHPELAEKARTWLRAGTRLVWLVWPRAEQVEVWQAESGPAATLGHGDWLEGGEVLPGFRLALVEVFET